MKDCIGNVLKVGDMVIFKKPNSAMLLQGWVKGFTEKMIIVSKNDEMCFRFPKHVVIPYIKTFNKTL